MGFGMVNAPIMNAAGSCMSKAQAGVTAAIVSTSRQSGAALGVAIAGTLVGIGRSRDLSFAQATHPVWWLMTSSGLAIGLLGWVSCPAWAKASTERIAHLLAEPS